MVRKLHRLVAGDRLAATVFAGGIVFFCLLWRLDVFVSDTDTLVATLAAVSDGTLRLNPVLAAPADRAPGMHSAGGRVYGRNYGQIFLTVPFRWALGAAFAIVDGRTLLAVTWSGLLAVVAVAGGVSRGRRDVVVVGCGVAASILAISLGGGGTIPGELDALIALQLSSIVAAALTAAVVCGLVARTSGRRVGAFAGATVVLATPVGFWATIPKRHGFTALFAVLALYYFFRSRDASTVRRAIRFRAVAYVPVGIATWVHAPEGLVLFVAIGTLDLFTARSNDPRRLAVVGTVFLLSLLPFLVTNTLIAGNPIEPPRALPSFDGRSLEGAGTGGPAAADVTVVAVGWAVLKKVGVFLRYMSGSALTTLDPERLFAVFVRSGHGLGLHRFGRHSVNLSVLESMPLASLLLVTPVLLFGRRTGAGGGGWSLRTARRGLRENPRRATDALAVGYLALLVVMYMPKLPIHASFTVRYLHPAYPIAVYLLARLGIVRDVVHSEWQLLRGTYAGFVLVGGPLFVGGLALFAGDVGEAVQLHARLSLAAAAVLLYWGAVSTAFDGYERSGAVALAFAGAVTTLYVLLSAWVYFPYGDQFALPAARIVADWLTLW